MQPQAVTPMRDRDLDSPLNRYVGDGPGRYRAHDGGADACSVGVDCPTSMSEEEAGSTRASAFASLIEVKSSMVRYRQQKRRC